MTILEAKQICRNYYELTNPSDKDRFLYSEALDYLISETKDPDYMNELGAMYYADKDFELALKYYEMAAEAGNRYAISNLGYIWYYGRTGEKNYKKAFFYFDKARRMGDVISAYKIADMYRNGYYVEKNAEKYKNIIESLYPQVKNARRLDEPLPEVFTRLAKIRSEEGKTDEALRLYDAARDFLAQRIRCSGFFGDLNIMKWMILNIYKLRKFDTERMDFYDLYYLLQTPHKVRFTCEDRPHEAEGVAEDGGISVRFDDRWYRTVDDFFRKAEIDGERLTALYEELYDFEVIGWN
jgi:tetratricopeptide (TPR) repeat protein